MIVGVHPLAGFDKLLHYRVPEPLRAAVAVGSLVRVPVLNRHRLGIVGEIGAPAGFRSRSSNRSRRWCIRSPRCRPTCCSWRGG